MTHSIIFEEHKTFEPSPDSKLLSYLEENGVQLVGMPDQFMGAPNYLGIDQNLTASYFIGATWLVKNELAAIVLPKIPNLDFMDMFLKALDVENEQVQEYFSKSYGIDFESPYIESAASLSQLTPLLIALFVSLIEKLLKQGLRKDYIVVEGSLKSKVKGRILLARQVKKNFINQRYDRTECAYQIYTIDTPPNRLLKRALLFVQRILKVLPQSSSIQKIHVRVNRFLSSFAEVADTVAIEEVRHIKGHKMFRHYAEAINVAKEILRCYDYSISNVSESFHKTPCFWIDMSRLFELYVYHRLQTISPTNILFQVLGYQKTAADFIHIDEKLIIDAKYKPYYAFSNSGILDDVREMSGYGRDLKVLSHFGQKFVDSNVEPGCLIVFPANQAFEPASQLESVPIGGDIWQHAINIGGFRNFRKIAVALPTI